MKKLRYNLIPLMVLMLAFVFIMAPASGAAVQFTDIKGHWAEDAIQRMADKGVATGFPDGSFRPDINISRAEFCTLLVKAFQLESKAGTVFNDTGQHWGKDYISTASAHGIVSGYENGSFKPDNNITREEMALMVVKAARLPFTPGALKSTDSDQVSSWAKDAVSTAYANNIITGMPDGSFRPLNNATRAEAIIVLDRGVEKYEAAGDGGTDQPPVEPPAASNISSIAVKTMPGTVNYTAGEKLNLNGLVVTLTRTDGSTEEIAAADFASRGITAAPAAGAELAASNTSVVITAGGQTADFKITVTPAPAGGGGGGGGGGGEGTTVAVTGVTLDRDNLELTADGVTSTLTATIAPAKATNKKLTWSSSDESVATVNNGVITPIAEGSATITVKTADGGYTDTCTVTVLPAPVSVTGVTIKTPPANVDYNEGNALDLTGLVVTLTKSDGSSEDVALADFADYSITVSPADGTILDTSNTEVIVTVNGEEAIQPITVNSLTITGIEIKTMPGKLTYTEGESLDLTGLVVTLTKSDGSTEDVSPVGFAAGGITTDPVSGAALETSDTEVVVTVDGYTATIPITVNPGVPVTVTDITIKTLPDKTAYTEGEALDLAGLVVTLTKSDGSTEEVSSADFAAKGITTNPDVSDALSISDTEVVITVNGKEAIQPITVEPLPPVTVTGVTIKTPPANVDYDEGNALDLSGLVVTLSKSDGSTEDVSLADFADHGINVSPADGTILDTSNTEVIITVNGEEAIQPITVEPLTSVTVTGVTIKTPPANVDYDEGDALDLSGLVVTLDKSDGSTEDVSLADFADRGINVSPADGTILDTSNTEVIITVNGKEAIQPITVNAAGEVTVENVSAENRAPLTNWYRFDVIGDYDEILIQAEDGTDLGPILSKADFEADGHYQGGVSPDGIIVIYIDGVEKYRGTPDEYTGPVVTVENVTAENRAPLTNWYRFDVIGDYEEILIQAEDGTDLGPVLSKADFEADGYYQGAASPDGIIVIYIDGVEKYRGTPDEYTGPVVTVENVSAENRAGLVNWYRFVVIGDYDEILIQAEDGTDLGPVLSKADFEADGYYQGGVSPDGIIVIYIDGVEKYRGTPDEYTGPVVTVENVSAENRAGLVNWYRFVVIGDYDEILIQAEDGTDLGPVLSKADFEADGHYQGAASPDGIIVIYIDGVEKYRGTPDDYSGSVVTVENVTAENRAGLVNWYRFDVTGDYDEILIQTKDGTDLGPVMSKADFAAAGHYQGGVSPEGIIVIYIDGVEKYRGTPAEYTGPVVTVTDISIKTPPAKIAYTEGEALDLSGLAVTLTKSDGSSEDVALADFAAHSITTAPADGAALGISDTQVVITMNGKTTAQAITVEPVSAVTVTDVTVKTAPAKLTYNEGEALDLTGLVVTLTKSDGTSEDVSLTDFAAHGITTAPINGAKLGTSDTEAVITVNGQTATQAITIETAPPTAVTGVTIKTPPAKTNYIEGEHLDLAGMVVTLTKSVGTTQDVVFADFAAHSIVTSPVDGSVLSTTDTAVVVIINSKTASQEIIVEPAPPVTITKIEVKTQPTKTLYNDGEHLDLAGLAVTLTKSDGSTEDVTLAGFAAHGINTAPANGAKLSTANFAVVITVAGKTTAISITVKPITVTGVAIKTPPAKLVYNDFEQLELAGMTVTLTKSDGSFKDVALADFGANGITTEPINGTVLRTTVSSVAVSVNGKTASQPITVIPIVTGVTIKTPPGKVVYDDGENLNLTGMVVTLAKSDGSFLDVALNNFAAHGITAAPVNGTGLDITDKTVVIAVDGYTATQNITVNPVVTHITIQNVPAKIEYYDGELLDLTGLAVTLTKSDGSTEDVVLADFTARGITTSPEDGARLSTSNNSIIITASGKTATQSIIVHPVTIANLVADRSNLLYNRFYFEIYGDYNEVYITDSVGVTYGGKHTREEFEAAGYIQTVKMINTTIRIYVDGEKLFDGVPPTM